MTEEETIKLHEVKQKLEATVADLSGRHSPTPTSPAQLSAMSIYPERASAKRTCRLQPSTT